MPKVLSKALSAVYAHSGHSQQDLSDRVYAHKDSSVYSAFSAIHKARGNLRRLILKRIPKLCTSVGVTAPTLSLVGGLVAFTLSLASVSGLHSDRGTDQVSVIRIPGADEVGT